MRVGVLGSGTVGQTLGAGFLKHGYQVLLGTRDPKTEDVGSWVAKNPGATAGTFAEAGKFGEILVIAVLARAVEDVIRLAGVENFRGKTVIDANNPIANVPPVDGVLQYITGPNQSLSEKIQALLPGARVVKAFNSVGAALMVNPHFEQGTPTMFFCGNDAQAKAQVSEIIRQFGWEPFDCGSIVAARALEPLCILWCIPGLQKNQWTHAFKLLTK
jgi:8-hydroxy-5-deazaflavin:NADPH oxidoreductase